MATIEGLDTVVWGIDAMNIDDNELRRIMREWTEYIRSQAVELCPVDTGELRQSIRKAVRGAKGGIEGIVYTNEEYAPYVEFGTGQRGKETNMMSGISYRDDWNGQAAQPFMYPALNNNIRKITKGMMDDILSTMGGGGSA